MKKLNTLWIIPIAFLFFFSSLAYSHCEIPCGIYDDHMRISMLKEHIGTMEKSMAKIIELEKSNNKNQLVRWVNNKERHAEEFQMITWHYFLTQRIKPDTEKYADKLSLLHKMSFYAMKCKQTTDMKNIEQLKELVNSFEQIYFGPKK